jgi:hypothetical protein
LKQAKTPAMLKDWLTKNPAKAIIAKMAKTLFLACCL